MMGGRPHEFATGSWQAVVAVVLTVRRAEIADVRGCGGIRPAVATLVIIVVLALIVPPCCSGSAPIAAILFVTANAGAWLLLSSAGNEQARAPFFLLSRGELAARGPRHATLGSASGIRELAIALRLLIPAIFGACWRCGRALRAASTCRLVLLPPPSA
jgi:hypothetical protein